MTGLAVEQDEAGVLDVLRRGGAYTAAELAVLTDLPIRSLHKHLRRLRDTAQVEQASQYQYRFFRLDVPETSPQFTGPVRKAADVPRDIRFARSCYGHLAGWLGVSVTCSLIDRGFIESLDDVFRLTQDGESWLDRLGILLPEKRVPRRRFARPCLDWTEKRPHLAGALGEVLLSHYVTRRWLERWSGERTLTLTPSGETALVSAFGITLR